MFRLKISKADKLFSLYIRHRAQFTCERCLTYYQPPTSALHCSHFHGRSKKSVRWDKDNAAAICYGCHRYLGSHPVEHAQFFLKRLGRAKFDALNLRADIPQKVDETLIVLGLQQDLEDMGIRNYK